MKETDDQGMELLLRRHAQRNLRASNGHGTAGEASSAHLDADELNAFAENALPKAARERYFSHLADCPSCRKLATALVTTAATTAGGAEAAHGKAQRGSFWQMLATLVSLPVMRYGVPVLTVLILSVVAFVVLRPGQRNDSVALKTEGPSAAGDFRPSITSTPEASTHAAAQPTVQREGASTGPNAPSKDIREEEQPLAASKKAGPSGYAGAANTAPPEFAPEPTAAPNLSTEQFKNSPSNVAAAAPPKSVVRDKNLVLMDKAGTDESLAKRGEADQRKDEQVSQRGVDAVPFGGLARENKEKGGPRRSQSQAESQSRSTDSLSSRGRAAPAPTRNLGGHRFRREGNMWVDAAYDSSRAVTTVSRNSEQYRKLVNDNEGLKAIVDELGSVIVVWNGKQYRIH
jgi:hypothetical protein